jgi:hypothetical protein
MRDVLPDLDHVTPEWLTEVLQDQRHLQDGCVTAVYLQKTWPTAVSLVAYLEVQYTDDISVSLPSQLFLKTSRPDLITNFPLRGQKEVVFYTRIAAAMPAPLVVRCYDAVYAPEAKKFHLVLEDVSASHVQATVWPVPRWNPSVSRRSIASHSYTRIGGIMPAWHRIWSHDQPKTLYSKPFAGWNTLCLGFSTSWATGYRGNDARSTSERSG